MGNGTEFKRELEQRAKEEIDGVEKIEWMGSIANEFRQGESDLDLIIWGNVPVSQKEKVSDMIRELNQKHSMGLETAPYQHPTPFFVDNLGKRAVYDLLVPKGGLAAFEYLRRIWKHHAPTYGQVWGLEDRAQKAMPRLAKLARRIYHGLI